MPLKFNQPKPTLWDQIKSYAPAVVRMGGGALGSIASTEPGIGTAIGAGVGGGAEALAEKMGGEDLDPKRIATEAALAAVPMGKIIRAGKAVSSAVGSGAYSAAGEALREKAQNQDLDPTSIAAHGALGALLGGVAGRFTTPKAEPPSAVAGPKQFDPTKPAANLVNPATGEVISKANVEPAPPLPKIKTQRSPSDIAGSSANQALNRVLKGAPRVATQAGVADIDKGIQSAGQAGMDLRQNILDEVPDVEKSHQAALDYLDKERTQALRENAAFDARKQVEDLQNEGATFGEPTVRQGASFEGPEGKTSISRTLEFPEEVDGEDGGGEAGMLRKVLGGGKRGAPKTGGMQNDVEAYQQTLYKGWLDRGENPVSAAKLARAGKSWTDIKPVDTTFEDASKESSVAPTTAQEPVAAPTPQPVEEVAPQAPQEVPASPLAKVLKTPRKARGPKVLTPNQRAAEDAYQALKARIEAEGRAPAAPTPEPPTEAPAVPQAPSPVAPEPEPQAPPAGPATIGGIFKSRVDASGQHYRSLKDLLKSGALPAEQAAAAKDGRNLAGQALRREAGDAGLPTGKPAPNYEVGGASQTAKASQAATAARAAKASAPSAEYLGWQEDSSHPEGGFPLFNVKGGKYDGSTVTAETLKQEGIPLPEAPASDATTTEQLDEAQAMKSSGDPIQKIISKLKGEAGGADVAMLGRAVSAAGGGAVGGIEGKKHGHPLAGALMGASVGAFGPELFGGLTKPIMAGQHTVTEAVPGRARKSLEIANTIRNSALLSPLSATKKALGDVGGYASAIAENPNRSQQLLDVLTSPNKLKAAWQAGKQAFNEPLAEDASGIEKSVNKGPLSFFPRIMGGLTAGTKNLMEQGGLSPEEAAYYTNTSEPETAVAGGLLRAQRGSLLGQHIAPFARMGLNRLERGMERSPLGLLRGRAWEPETQNLALRQAALGTMLGIGTYEATPDDFLKNHPAEASLISAAAGPYGVPIAAAMAAKTRGKQPFSKATQEITKDVPGLRFLEEASSGTKFIPNYLAGYTNVLAPLAQLLSPQDVQTNQPGWRGVVDRAAANIPGVRNRMAKKLPPLKFR